MSRKGWMSLRHQKVEKIYQDHHPEPAHGPPGAGQRYAYRSLVEQQPDLLCSFLPDGTCTFANAAYASFIGRTESEIPRTNYLAIIPKNERERIRNISHP